MPHCSRFLCRCWEMFRMIWIALSRKSAIWWGTLLRARFHLMTVSDSTGLVISQLDDMGSSEMLGGVTNLSNGQFVTIMCNVWIEHFWLNHGTWLWFDYPKSTNVGRDVTWLDTYKSYHLIGCVQMWAWSSVDILCDWISISVGV